MEKSMWRHPQKMIIFPIFPIAAIWTSLPTRIMSICVKTVRFMGQNSIRDLTAKGRF